MKQAVVKIAGKQYLVKEGQALTVDRIKGRIKTKVNFKEVLLVADDDKVEIGQPVVNNRVVATEIVDHFKAKKIRVAKFKAKSRYRRRRGHRQLKTRLKIVKI